MDAFTVVLLVGLVGFVVLVMVVGRSTPRSAGDPFGLRSAREIVETREALEAEDLAQMLAAHNARRRARGEPEQTVADIEARLIRDRNELARERAALMDERELDQLLEATNARRRARGLPERTREEVRREFGAGAARSARPADGS